MTCKTCEGLGWVLHNDPPTIDCPECVTHRVRRPVDESVGWAELAGLELEEESKQRADLHAKLARRYLILTWMFGGLTVAWVARLAWDVWRMRQ